jgi:hypothetical protein
MSNHRESSLHFAPRERKIGATVSRLLTTIAVACLFAGSLAHAAQAGKPRNPGAKPSDEQKAWINARGMCVFPFAAEKLPDNSDDFTAAMERGYRKSLKLSQDGDEKIVVAEGGSYPNVKSLKIDVSDSVVLNPDRKRNPSKRAEAVPGIDASKFEFIGKGMSMEKALVDVTLSASDAKLMLTRDDKDNKPLLFLGRASEGRINIEIAHKDAERLLLAAARKGGKGYGLNVDKTKLELTVDPNGRTIFVVWKLFTRFGPAPAGLKFKAQLDIDDKLNGQLSHLSCSGDDVLGPLMSGLIRPFLAKYNGKTRPLMTFPKTEIRLRAINIASDDSIRITVDFGT